MRWTFTGAAVNVKPGGVKLLEAAQVFDDENA